MIYFQMALSFVSGCLFILMAYNYGQLQAYRRMKIFFQEIQKANMDALKILESINRMKS